MSTRTDPCDEYGQDALTYSGLRGISLGASEMIGVALGVAGWYVESGCFPSSGVEWDELPGGRRT